VSPRETFGNAVLLPEGSSVFRTLQFPDGRRAFAQDYSYYRYIAEDLIRHSAVVLAVRAAGAEHIAAALAPPIRARMKRVDRRSRIGDRARAVLAPVAEDIGVKFRGPAVWHQSEDVDGELAVALLSLSSALERLLLGITDQLHVAVDVDGAAAAVEALRGGCSSSYARANLAILDGVLATYEPVDVPALVARPNAPEDLTRHFVRFVEDETYRELSHEAHLLGVPAKVRRAVALMRRRSEDLLRKPNVQDVVDAGTETLSLATQIPSASASTISRLLGDTRYLPPLVSLAGADGRARTAWREDAPEFLHPHPDLAGAELTHDPPFEFKV
jgi:hypothetical protein